MSPYCTNCGYQEAFCRCPMRTQDLVLSVAIVCIALAFALAMWLRSTPVQVPVEQQEQGRRLLPSSMPSPRWLQIYQPRRPPNRLA